MAQLLLSKFTYRLDNWSSFNSESWLKTVIKLKHSMKVIIQKMRMKMEKFLVLASILFFFFFVTTILFSIAFNINMEKDAHAVENIFNGQGLWWALPWIKARRNFKNIVFSDIIRENSFWGVCLLCYFVRNTIYEL